MKKDNLKNNPLNENRHIPPHKSMHAVNYQQLSRTATGMPFISVIGIAISILAFLSNSLYALIFFGIFAAVNLLLIIGIFMTKVDFKKLEKTSYKKSPEDNLLKKLTKKQVLNIITFNVAYIILFIVIMLVNPHCLFG